MLCFIDVTGYYNTNYANDLDRFDTENVRDGKICTIQCPKYNDCEHKKNPNYKRISFLVEMGGRLITRINPNVQSELFLIGYQTYCLTSDAEINNFVDQVQGLNEPRPVKKNVSGSSDLKAAKDMISKATEISSDRLREVKRK